jgi:hypothetical protein
MIGQQGPGIDRGLRFFSTVAQAGDKVLPVFVVIYDSTPFNPPYDNVMQRSWRIESRLAGHRTSFGNSNFTATIFIIRLNAYAFNS